MMPSKKLKRILAQIKKINEEENDSLEEKCIISVGHPIEKSNNYECDAVIRGPKATPYESGNFKLKIKFPENYPFRAPSICFLTKIFHVNIHFDGEICCESYDHIINNKWAPTVTLKEVLIEIINLLKFPNFETCHLYGYPDDLRERCYSQKDYIYYNKIANEWTVKYANGNYNEFFRKDGNITEYNKEIRELITNFEKELDKVNEFYLKLIKDIEENKNKIIEEKKQLKELQQKLIELSSGDNYYFNKCKLKDLRDDLIKKDREISELNLYFPPSLKERLMTLTIISKDEEIHFTTTCHKKDYLSKIKELLFEQYPEYKKDKNIFYLKDKKIGENKSLENNGVKDNDILLLKNL